MDGRKLLTDLHTIKALKRHAKMLLQSFEGGNGEAGYELATMYDPFNTLAKHLKDGLPVNEAVSEMYYSKAYDVLLRNADMGDAQAMRLLSLYFQAGTPPVQYDANEFISWNLRALAAGCIFAANDLYAVFGDPNSGYYNRKEACRLLQLLKKNEMLVVPEFQDGAEG